MSRRRLYAMALGAVVAAALLAPASSPAAAGSLDRSFNGNGRLVIPTPASRKGTPFDNPFEVTRVALPWALFAAGPGGEVIVASKRSLRRYRADGQPQRRFGRDGSVVVPLPAGASFELAGLAVDSRGRVLVAGTTKPTGATGGSQPARLAVYRFLSSGRLDRGFGADGVAGAALGPLNATGLAVDSRDRPVLTAVSALTPSHCNSRPVYLNTTVVARLTATGAPDPAFGGGDGAYTDPFEDPRLPALAANGKVVFTSAAEGRCAGFDGYGAASREPVASVLSPSGSLALRAPVRPTGPSLPGLAGILEVTSLAVDRRNRIVLLETAYPPEGGDYLLQVVRRLLPDGRPDPEFGGRSYMGAGIEGTPNPPGGVFAGLTTDARNRIVLAGSATRREGGFVGQRFLAARLNAAGVPQSWFGEGGLVTVRIGRQAEAGAWGVHLDSRGRIVLGGSVAAPAVAGGHGIALVRLLSGGR